ncbi:MAG: hydroxymethylglutaryl-CoA lyase [Terriglobales bacterium]
METVKWIECPRDALQGCPRPIPAELKAELLRRLLAAGFHHLDCASFVSPQAVPQMADAEAVLARLGPVPAGAELIGIVLNRRGAERAAATTVSTLGFPFSISPTFQQRNAHQSLPQARDELRAIQDAAGRAARKLIVYISMAFGNPYGDAYAPELVAEAVAWSAGLGVAAISLADTVGRATAQQIAALFAPLRRQFPALELGLHLHGRRETAAAKVGAAYAAGCRRFDGALAGLGGCPFADDDLVGNIPSEIALPALAAAGARVPATAPDWGGALELIERLRRDYCAPARETA